jgi:hypothetical protein
MTSPSSSISSSEAARYLGLVLLAAAIVVSGIAGISLIGIEQGLVTWKEAKLLRHQLDKIDAASRVDVLLVGDSTLGNTVDAEAWSRESGQAVLSLPLTGDYGYGGTLNMLRRVLRRHRPGAGRGLPDAGHDAAQGHLRRPHVHGRDPRRYPRHPALAAAGPARKLGDPDQHAGQRAHARRA